MSPALIDALRDREPALLGQTVVVIGGSAGIGFEAARRARAEGANIILTGRTAERLQQALLESFFRDLPAPIDHVMLTGPGPR
jgi:NAD(P)-dependent dehydrogenase (short-subunit alcohol dehydrogenase family)